MIEQSHHAAESETSVAPTFGASGEEDITYIPVTGSSPRENYDVLVGHNLLKKIPDILGNTAHKILVIHPRAYGLPASLLWKICVKLATSLLALKFLMLKKLSTIKWPHFAGRF